MKSKLLFSFELLLILLLIVALFGCGGKGKQSSITSSGLTQRAGADQTFEGITHDGFELVPTGPNGKPDASQKSVLAFSVTPDTGTTKVTISAVNATNLKYALLTLKYDPGKMKPTKVEYGDFLSGDVLKFSLLDRAGIVPVGICKVNPDKAAGASGSGILATVSFINTPFGGKGVSAPPQLGPTGTWRTINKVTDLAQPVGNQPGITWTEKLDADGNLNGEVEISDLVPIAQHYGVKPSVSPQYTNIDYNVDDDIGIADLQPMAYFYSDTITGYDLYYGTVATGNPAPVHSALTRLGATIPDILRPGSTPNGTFGWYTYAYNVPAPAWPPAVGQDLYIQVVATGFQNGTSGPQAESDEATLGSSIIPMSTTGTEVHLITKIYLQANGNAAGETGAAGTADVQANTGPAFTMYQVDDFNTLTSATVTRAATAQEKADTTWTTSAPAVVPFAGAGPYTDDQTSPGVTPDWDYPATAASQSTIHTDYYGRASTNTPPIGSPPPGQTHVQADCTVTITEDPNAAVVYSFAPTSGTIMNPPGVIMYVKNYDIAVIPPGEVAETQYLVLEPAPGNPSTLSYTFDLYTGLPPTPPQSYAARVLSPPDPMWPNATHSLQIAIPSILIAPGDYRWRVMNNLGKGTPVVPAHPSNINEPPYDDITSPPPLPPIVTAPGTIYHMAGLENIPSVTFPWHEVWNDNPEVWIYPQDPIIRKDGDTDAGGNPLNPAWFGIWIKGQNNLGVMTNGKEWTITAEQPANPPQPLIPASPTGEWNPGAIPLPMSFKNPWALITDASALTGSPSGNNYTYSIIGFGGVQQIGTGQVNVFDLPGPGAGYPDLKDFGFEVWGSDGLSTSANWTQKTVSLTNVPTIVCSGKAFIPSSLPGQNAIVALCSDAAGTNEWYYVKAKVVKSDDPIKTWAASDPESQSWVIFTLLNDGSYTPGTYYLKVKNLLVGYVKDSTVPTSPLVINP